MQIKATQGNGVGIRAEPEHLLVLKILRDGTVHEAYNGPGGVAWSAAGKMQKNGQRPISLSKLKKLMENVKTSKRIPIKKELGGN